MAAQNLLAGILMALAFLLALLTLVAGLRPRREGLASSQALVAATLALLVCCASLVAFTAGWMGPATSLTVLAFGLLLLALALGWAMLSRRSDFQRTTEAAQFAAAAHQARDLEIQVEERNAELSARLRDLGEARRSAEVANQSLQLAMEELEQAAATDRLTGAWNRRRFEEAVLPEIARAHRRRDPLCLLMFDLDHFKQVNDTFGHGTGDVVLASTAQTVRQHLRLSDSLIRWGGEEFLVMAPATGLEGAMGLAEKLRTAVAAIEFLNVGLVTISLGVSEYALGEGFEEWIERTDQALYSAKTQGRNRVVSAPPPKHPGSELLAERSLLEILWEDTYASGHALIDDQHQRLFHLASGLMFVLTESRPLAEVSLRLESLLAHTAQHFHDEEALLREASYPDLAEHAAIHATLLKKARRLQADVQAGQLDFGKLVRYLALDLVKGHILTEDRNYFAHLVDLSGSDEVPLAGA
jgi:diguanylate cyclase (GGDEF)-like protein/hemerythrin-like metal-binding protein